MRFTERGLSRREFFAAGAAGLLAAGAARADAAPPVCVFSKHFPRHGFDDLAELGRRCGLDGFDLTVRPGGHVPPERVAEELPRAADTIRAAGLDIPMITTRLTSGDDPEAGPVLEAAARAGIRYFRVGGHKYSKDGDPLVEIEDFIRDLRSLAALAETHGLTAGYHNHSGGDNFGAPVWDLLRALEAVDSPALGSNYDIGHATAEGPYGDWPITARAMAPRVKMTAVKDFVSDRGRPRWTTLGEGEVRLADHFRIFRDRGFAGPVSIHFENPEFNRAGDSGKEAQLSAAVKLVRRELRKAGYGA